MDSVFTTLNPHNRIRYIYGTIEENSTNLNSIGQILDNAYLFASQNNDRNLKDEILFIKKTQPTYLEKDAKKRLNIFKKLLDYYRKKGDLLHQAYCLHQIGQNQFVLEEFASAFDNIFKAQTIYKNIGYQNVPVASKHLHDLALNFYFFKDYSGAINAMKISIRLPSFNENLDIQRFNTLGMSYLKLEKPDSALLYLNIAMDKAVIYDNNVWIGLMNGYIGEVYFKKKDYQKAQWYFLKSYDIVKQFEQYPEILIHSNGNLGELYVELDELDKAFYHIGEMKKYFFHKSPFQFGEQQQFEVAKKQYFNIYYRYYLKRKQYHKALPYLDSLNLASKMGFEKYNAALIKMSQDKLKIQENLAIIQQQKESKSRMHFLYCIYLVLLCFLGIFLLTLYFNVRKKNKKEKELFLANEKINELKKQEIERELEFAKMEISQFLEKINQKNQLIDQVTSKLKKIQGEYSTEQSQIKQTLQELRESKILTDDDWNSFQMGFEKIHPNLVQVIRKKYPKITNSELRYLMLSKIGMTHKEMANNLGISNDSIRVTWNRVRHKLGGTLEDNSITLLKKIEKTFLN